MWGFVLRFALWLNLIYFNYKRFRVEDLKLVHADAECAVYEIAGKQSTRVDRLVVSTPETRRICNDSLVLGLEYTRLLECACKKVIQCLQDQSKINLVEKETIVFNILRGGLNFGLREALGNAFDWNMHGSSFISAQRARASKNSEDWHIIESGYKKVYTPEHAQIVIGDIVATGTSLRHGLKALIDEVQSQGSALKSILFFTIGAPMTENILEEVDALCRKKFPAYEKTTLCYIEGRFSVPSPDTDLTIKVTGTDLVKKDALISPELLTSQYESPSYAIERCVIYDAGSRAFWLPEYVSDVRHYWEQTLALAEQGMSYVDLLQERMPTVDPSLFQEVSLKEVCLSQLERINLLHGRV